MEDYVMNTIRTRACGWIVLLGMAMLFVSGCSGADMQRFMGGFEQPPPVVPADPNAVPPVVAPPPQPEPFDMMGMLLAALLPAAYYPILHRPIRKWAEGLGKKDG